MARLFAVMAVVAILAAPAMAGYVNQSYQFSQTRVHLGVGQNGGETWMNSSVDSTLLVHSVYADLYPNSQDPSEFVWSFGFSGRRDLPAIIQNLGGYVQYGTGGVWFTQNTYLGGNEWQDGSLHNYGSADMSLSPATFSNFNCYYNEWEQGGGGNGLPVATEKWWGVNGSFYGSFGFGPEGDEIGRAFFGLPTPEPTTMILLASGAAFFARRRRH